MNKYFILSLFLLCLPGMMWAQEETHPLDGKIAEVNKAFGEEVAKLNQELHEQFPKAKELLALSDEEKEKLDDTAKQVLTDFAASKGFLETRIKRGRKFLNNRIAKAKKFSPDKSAEAAKFLDDNLVQARGLLAKNLDDKVNETVAPATDWIFSIIFASVSVKGESVPFVVIWLVVGALIFTLFMGFINIRGFGLAVNIVRGCYSNPNDTGEVSHFQALTAALSGTVGLGNIAGVAIAISKGGPGATFWMILAGLLGMSSKFVECTLGVKYRVENEDGSVSGGPMYYLSRGFAELGMGGVGKVLAVFFAVMCIGGALGGGNMFQINQSFEQVQLVTGGYDSPLYGYGWAFGVVVAVLVAIVIIGGIRSIASVTDKLVPFMCGIYVIAALTIILGNIGRIPEAIGLIFKGAFTPDAAFGGFLGVLIIGFQRAAFSNEAGIGSASIAHSAVKTNEPVTEGLVSLLEPFIDTVVVCTMTALVIVITGTVDQATGEWSPLVNSTEGGIEVTSGAFASVISWFPIILSIAATLFAFSTMITWSYYGLQAWQYLFGKSKAVGNVFKLIFCIFVVVGAAMALGKVTDFSDAMIFAMCFPNVIGLYVLSFGVRKDLSSFLTRVQSGEIKRFK